MPIGLRRDRSWAALPATTASDLLPFWKRHLQTQMRLYTAAAARGEAGRHYRAAVVWGLTALLHGLEACASADDLLARAQDAMWWDQLCRDELESPSLLELRVRDVPLAGKGLAECALGLRYLELTRRVTVDPTVVLDTPSPPIAAWLAAE